MMVAALARFVASAAPSAPAVRVATPAIADCFGAMLAGADSEVAVNLRQVVAGFGAGDAAVYGTALRLSPPYAALVNAVAGHAWDLDDWEEPGNTHPSVVILPALLAAAAIAREENQPCSGEQLMAAYCVGAEVIMRLGEAVSLSHYERGFHSTATLGVMGAAAASARLLRLPADAVSHALGFAVSNASGYTMQFGSNAKALQAGWPARAGLEAACLARQGLTARPETLVSARGFAGLMGEHDPARLEAMAAKLGQPWALEEYGLVLKPWASCGYTHRIMTAAMKLRPKLLKPLEAIAAIDLSVIDFHYEILPFTVPKSRLEALFSLPACTAQMLVNGSLTLADSENGFWHDPQVARLIDRTRVTARKAKRPALNYDPEQPDIMEVTLTDGSRLDEAVAYPLGAAQNPMSTAQLAAKYSAATGRPARQFDRLLDWPTCREVTDFFEEAQHG